MDESYENKDMYVDVLEENELITIETYSFNKDDIDEFISSLAFSFPEHVNEPKRIFEIINTFKADDLFVIVENQYVDRASRELYYHCYSQMYEEYERNCVRLTFFDELLEDVIYEQANDDNENKLNKALIGTMVLRPLQIGNIGTTYLNPHKLKTKGYFRTCRFEFMVYGYKLSIQCFPYSSQDAEMMTCAENAIFNILHYFGKKYSDYRAIMPLEIQQGIENESYQRVFPSVGLSEEEIAKVLLDNHLYPKIYRYSDELNDTFEHIMYYYAESGIPFILNIPGHSVIVIGHAEKDQQLNFKNSEPGLTNFVCSGDLFRRFIIMDDNLPPYQSNTLHDLVKRQVLLMIGQKKDTIRRKSLYKLIDREKRNSVSIIVPLYRRIFLDADTVYDILKTVFFNNDAFLGNLRKEYNDPTWGTKSNPFIYRVFLCTAHNFKSYKNKTTTSKKLRHTYNTAFMPRMVWVCEITTMELIEEKIPLGRVEILIDATASVGSYLRGLMFVRYKDHMITSRELISYLNNKYTFDEEELEGLISARLASDAKTDYDYMKDLFLTEFIDSLEMKTFTGELEAVVPAVFPMYIGSNLKGEI